MFTVIINRIFVLLFAHLIGDYGFQSSFLAQFKSKNDFLLLVHSSLWTGCISTGLLFIGRYRIWKVLFLVIVHCLIDYWKCHKKNQKFEDLYIDQFLHMIQLFVVYLNV